MLNLLSWLPEPLDYTLYYGKEDAFIDAAYQVFCQDFKTSSPMFRGKPVKINTITTYQGREETFWHLISKNSTTTNNRIPDYERCERVPWIRPLIQSADSQTDVLVWEQKRRDQRNKSTKRVAILLNHTQCAHIVFLQERKEAYYLITTYYVSPGPKLQRYLNEYQNSQPS